MNKYTVRSLTQDAPNPHGMSIPDVKRRIVTSFCHITTTTIYGKRRANHQTRTDESIEAKQTRTTSFYSDDYCTYNKDNRFIPTFILYADGIRYQAGPQNIVREFSVFAR